MSQFDYLPLNVCATYLRQSVVQKDRRTFSSAPGGPRNTANPSSVLLLHWAVHVDLIVVGLVEIAVQAT